MFVVLKAMELTTKIKYKMEATKKDLLHTKSRLEAKLALTKREAILLKRINKQLMLQ